MRPAVAGVVWLSADPCLPLVARQKNHYMKKERYDGRNMRSRLTICC